MITVAVDVILDCGDTYFHLTGNQMLPSSTVFEPSYLGTILLSDV
jgi:hypothetical protein